MFLKTILVSSLVLIASDLANCQKDCEAILDKSDSCFKKVLFLGDTSTETPTSMSEMDAHCKVVGTSLPCLRAYNKCLKNFPRQIFAMLINNMNKFAKAKCTSSGKKAFLENMSCLTPAIKPKVDRHLNKFSALVSHIATNVTKNHKFSWACCSYFHVLNQLQSELDSSCGRQDASTAKYMTSGLTSLVAEVMELGCGKFNSLENCNRLNPTAMETLSRLSDEAKDNDASILRPLVKMAVSLDA